MKVWNAQFNHISVVDNLVYVLGQYEGNVDDVYVTDRNTCTLENEFGEDITMRKVLEIGRTPQCVSSGWSLYPGQLFI